MIVNKSQDFLKYLETACWIVLSCFILIEAIQIAYDSVPPFDAAYNFLSYRNWVDHGRFEHVYGRFAKVPLDPVISTGPTINALIALVYAIYRHSDAFFLGTAVTTFFYIALFIFWSKKFANLSFVSFVLLIFFLFLFENFIRDWFFFSGLGEFASVCFFLIGVRQYIFSKGRLGILWGSLALGFSIVTKQNMALPILFVLLFLASRRMTFFGHILRKRRFKIRKNPRVMSSIYLSVAGLTLIAAPQFIYSKVLPWTLDSGSVEAFKVAKKARNEELRALGFFVPLKVKDVAIDKERSRAIRELKANFAEKSSVFPTYFPNFGGLWTTCALLSCLLVLASTRMLTREEKRFTWALFCSALVLTAWWWMSNKNPWWRYFSQGQFLFIFFTIFVLDRVIIKNFRSAIQMRPFRKDFVLVGVVGVLVGSFGFRYASTLQISTESLKGHFSYAKEQKDIVLALGRKALELSNEIAPVAWGWFQAPEPQAVFGNHYTNILDGREREGLLSTNKRLMFVTTPATFIDARSRGFLEFCQKVSLFKEGDYSISELDPQRVDSWFKRNN